MTLKSNEMTCRRLLSSALLVSAQSWLVLLFMFIQGSSSLTHEELFPSLQEEYDHKILDPKTVHGSPYGGFARASRSRLAALPLSFPATLDEEVPYMTVADGEGREFICKTYKEDEIASVHLKDSLFDPVVSYSASQSELDENEVSSSLSDKISVESAGKWMNLDLDKVFSSALQGVCTQLHQGWWSYEWCFGQIVRQFHVARAEVLGTQVVTMESITSMGSFVARVVKDKDTLDEEARKRHAHKLTAVPSNAKHALYDKQEAQERFILPFRGKEKELATVIDTHTNGALCDMKDENGGDLTRPRSTVVNYRCCDPENMKKLKPLILYKGHRINSDIATIAKLEEPSTCRYEITICTPLLCEGHMEYYKDGPLATIVSTVMRGMPEKSVSSSKRLPKPNESIQDLLDRVLDDVCLQTNTNQWWLYEFCHDQHVRQFHEAQIFDPISGVTSRRLESQYFLGYYDEDDEGAVIPKNVEHKHVVNVTSTSDTLDLLTQKPVSSSNNGNGAYFPIEYKGGEECSGEDAKSKGGMPRATTVRYFCGPHFELKNVNEDSTCHYVVDVTVPDLCQHALFRKADEKKKVIKCLPIQ